MSRVWFLLGAVLLACEEPPPQDPSQAQTTYQNGYAQTIGQANATPRSSAPAASGATPGAPVTYAAEGAQPSPTVAQPAATLAPPQGGWSAPPEQAGPQPMQATPVQVGVQALPPPATTGTGPTALPMATPGPGAFVCTSDAQCMLGRCNMRYGRCAYPCKNSALDCKAGNVCTAAGLCMPRIAGGVGM